MIPASHPRACRSCDGTGWMFGPPITEIVNGRQISYPTRTTCTADWRDEDPSVDGDGLERLTPSSLGEYLRRLRIRSRRGEALAELEVIGWKRARGGDLFGDGS